MIKYVQGFKKVFNRDIYFRAFKHFFKLRIVVYTENFFKGAPGTEEMIYEGVKIKQTYAPIGIVREINDGNPVIEMIKPGITKQMVQEKIADSWMEIEQFRLIVLRTAWRIDKHGDYMKVRKDIAAIKALMPKVYHDVASRALMVHGSLGASNEMPRRTGTPGL